jgi:mRNA interferase YafQ
MKILKVTKLFKKDGKKIKNQGKDLSKLNDVLDCICKGLELETKYLDHMLSGNY